MAPSQLNQARLEARVQRARAAVGRGIKYHMGSGGLHPDDPLPSRDGLCDCTGFASWCLYMSRDLSGTGKAKTFGFDWIETTLIHKDILGPQKLFVRVAKPTVGGICVWGDGDGGDSSGHIGIVSKLHDNGTFDVIDCASGSSRTYGEAIREHLDPYFQRHPGTVYGVLREDLA